MSIMYSFQTGLPICWTCCFSKVSVTAILVARASDLVLLLGGVARFAGCFYAKRSEALGNRTVRLLKKEPELAAASHHLPYFSTVLMTHFGHTKSYKYIINIIYRE